jgi:hypothetical protein
LFRDVIVSATMIRVCCVLRVLNISLMIRGFRPPATGRRRKVSKSPSIFTYGKIWRRGADGRRTGVGVGKVSKSPSIFTYGHPTAGAPGLTFFLDWIRTHERFQLYSWSVPVLSFLKKLNIFSSISYITPMRHSQLRDGPSRIDDTKIQERCEPALRRDTDVNWIKSVAKLLSVEVQTLTESTGMVQGARGSWIDINSHFLGSVWLRGIDISFIDFFLWRRQYCRL